MNFIKRVVVEGFWGDKKIDLNLEEDVNFLVGVNGSGKTTFINLIASVLKADFSNLDKIEFDKIRIVLKESKGRKKPEVVVEKKEVPGSPFGSIEYSIKASASESPTVYPLDDFAERMLYRDIPHARFSREMRKVYGKDVIESLNMLTQVSWLSVHRAPPTDERSKLFESTVDRKLDELSNRLVRYFSTLNLQGAALLEKFQETIFLSMLVGRHQKDLFNRDSNLDLESEKEALNSIFSQFNLDKKKYSARVEHHFSTLSKATDKANSNQGLSYIDVAAIVLNDRIDQIIEDWNLLIKRRETIFRPREIFLSIVNGLMQRKSFDINDKNELDVTTQSGKKLPIRFLSSGEKQLLIILGEALLQEKSACIYIADEPELSLHVMWQERLVDNLLALNPNAQIIFATHSPDVVSSYGNKVIKMEEQF
ncbi:AAA family ATPase [Halomonas alkaliantarctica]|uniref:AAA family ATPase n=1 Tax=Halomonas alkaliantarctica TaxID=232346 RepID=UPI002659FE6D|nr:AAA family ATPase [Halomonas alkaliantarctica]